MIYLIEIEHNISFFDQVYKNIRSILKQSPIPLSNKTLLESLSAENEVCISNLEHFAPSTKRTVFAH